MHFYKEKSYMEYFTLNNGIQIPATGFGVFRISDGKACIKAVLDAINSGYRMFDTAQGYWNEESVGAALQTSGIDRKELFLTTKIWMGRYSEADTRRSVMESMEKLRTDYLDLVLLHQPVGDFYGAYRALETLYEDGKIRAIGVSNFSSAQLADLSIFNRVIPAVNQIQITPFIQETSSEIIHQRFQIRMEACAPLGAGNPELLTNPILTAIGKACGKSPAQVILRWLYQRGIITIVKSTHTERMKENISLFDFQLSAEHMSEISKLNRQESDPRFLEKAEYPLRMKALIDRESYHFHS